MGWHVPHAVGTDRDASARAGSGTLSGRLQQTGGTMKIILPIVVGVAAALAASGCVNHPELMSDQRCEWPSAVVAGGEGTVPTHLFAGIDTGWTLARIFARLGPARRDAGEFTYEWVAADGRVFVAAASSRCGLVRRAGFVDPPPPG